MQIELYLPFIFNHHQQNKLLNWFFCFFYNFQCCVELNLHASIQMFGEIKEPETDIEIMITRFYTR